MKTNSKPIKRTPSQVYVVQRWSQYKLGNAPFAHDKSADIEFTAKAKAQKYIDNADFGLAGDIRYRYELTQKFKSDQAIYRSILSKILGITISNQTQYIYSNSWITKTGVKTTRVGAYVMINQEQLKLLESTLKAVLGPRFQKLKYNANVYKTEVILYLNANIPAPSYNFNVNDILSI